MQFCWHTSRLCLEKREQGGVKKDTEKLERERKARKNDALSLWEYPTAFT